MCKAVSLKFSTVAGLISDEKQITFNKANKMRLSNASLSNIFIFPASMVKDLVSEMDAAVGVPRMGVMRERFQTVGKFEELNKLLQKEVIMGVMAGAIDLSICYEIVSILLFFEDKMFDRNVYFGFSSSFQV